MNTTLRQRQPQFGTWLQIGSPIIAELADASGFDWLLIDLEHGCSTDAMVPSQIQGIRNAAPIVRVSTPQPDLISRVLDWGAAGIMVPMVSTVEKAEACVRAMHYPPRGDRGFADMARSHRYGLESETASPVFFAQIETIEGVENARSIAAVEGVDVLFVGPMDLQLNLKAYPQRATRDYADCLREVAAAAESAGKASGLIMRKSDDAAAFQSLGFTHLAIETDITVLREGYRQLLQPLRGAGSNGSSPQHLNGHARASRSRAVHVLPVGSVMNDVDRAH